MQNASKIASGTLAAALFVLMAAAPAVAAAPQSSGPFVQVAAQQMKKMPTRGTGPVRPIAPNRLAIQQGGGTSANDAGCHDGASMTSYEGSCDIHPEYEATGGCESDTTGTSYPGNCANSSEP